ncbi:hypothetical protein APR41_06265 [Salegentibacter salinarum]|uniref:DoxX family protein n=1 Tax=Salegentibacter salinarum TaxID=447422 RepID=A0A2N0TQM2_9FLAO|nr:hypothetical protein [Salegentibacter salinarum]PKD17035.1 hypothetical protein APR41_06265 [Salegentibacter salinarum]SKB54105.1 Uncharacterized membrane protein [Salegentibacter salinarum]
MKPLIVLIFFFLVAIFAVRVITGIYNFPLSARIGISVMLLFTAMGHFIFPEGMVLMIPDFIPFKKSLVYFTALIEIFGAIGLHIPQFRILTAWLLILFFLAVLPANIKASIEGLDYQKATYDGNGLMYLWFRIPLQILFILWIYFSTIRIK